MISTIFSSSAPFSLLSPPPFYVSVFSLAVRPFVCVAVFHLMRFWGVDGGVKGGKWEKKSKITYNDAVRCSQFEGSQCVSRYDYKHFYAYNKKVVSFLFFLHCNLFGHFAVATPIWIYTWSNEMRMCVTRSIKYLLRAMKVDFNSDMNSLLLLLQTMLDVHKLILTQSNDMQIWKERN